MDDPTGPPNLTAIAMADPPNQLVQLYFADGTPFTVTMAAMDYTNYMRTAKAITYGSEIGASIMMLLVVLTMTPKTKFWRLSSYVNIAALVINVIRTFLLVDFFVSSWLLTYVIYAQDVTYVEPKDYRISVAATIFAIPQAILVLVALMLQAWAMLELWPSKQKMGVLVISGLLIVTTLAFKITTQVIQSQAIYLGNEELLQYLWVRAAALNLEVTSVCWFCFLFNLRLVIHLWTNRSFLPTTKGLSAMDVLIMTNGFLMLVPVIFAAIQFSSELPMESGSLVYTSVVIVLPLGTLVAQRTANPAAFNSAHGGHGCHDGSMRITSDSCNDNSTLTTTTTTTNNNNNNDNNNNNNKPLLRSWRTESYSGASRKGSGAGLRIGVTSTVSPSSRPLNERGKPMSSVDMELARIDGNDLEKGLGMGLKGGGVRVDREIEWSEERLF